jgi:hypothetical protein
VEYSFDDKSKCCEIAKVGDWLLASVPNGTKDPKRFWEPNNLWGFCIHVDGDYTIGRYRAMELLYEHGLEEPAKDLARPIAEVAFRLDYLSHDDEQLVDYARWQLLDCYHRVLKRISETERLGAEIRAGSADDMAEIKAILSERFSEKPLRPTWKNFDQMITFESKVEDQDRKRKDIYMQTGVTLSRGLHNAWLFRVPSAYGSFVGRMSFVMAMDRIGKICLNKKLVSVRGANYAKKIVELCGLDGWPGR